MDGDTAERSLAGSILSQVSHACIKYARGSHRGRPGPDTMRHRLGVATVIKSPERG